MKTQRFVIHLLLTFVLASKGWTAVPTLESFDPTKFVTNANRVAYSETWTNEFGAIVPAVVNTGVLVTNFSIYGRFATPAKVTLLSLGTNYIDTTLQNTWLFNSPTNDASQVILSLSAAAEQGARLTLLSQNGAGAFTLPNLSEQYDVPGAYVFIGSDWIATTNRGISLVYTAPDWVLDGVPWDPSVPGGGGGGATINPTDGFIPVRFNSSTFANSPISIDAQTNIVVTNLTSNLPGFIVSAISGQVEIFRPPGFSQAWLTLFNRTTSDQLDFFPTGLAFDLEGNSNSTFDFESVATSLDGEPRTVRFTFGGTNGFLIPKDIGQWPNDPSKYFDGTGHWSTPGGGGSALWALSGGDTLVPSPVVDSVGIPAATRFTRGDASAIAPMSYGPGVDALVSVTAPELGEDEDWNIVVGSLSDIATASGGFWSATGGTNYSQMRAIVSDPSYANGLYYDGADSDMELSLRFQFARLVSFHPTVASGVANLLNTSNSLTNGDKTLSIANAGTEYAYFGPGGSPALSVTSLAADNATNVALVVDTANSFLSAGSAFARFANANDPIYTFLNTGGMLIGRDANNPLEGYATTNKIFSITSADISLGDPSEVGMNWNVIDSIAYNYQASAFIDVKADDPDKPISILQLFAFSTNSLHPFAELQLAASTTPDFPVIHFEFPNGTALMNFNPIGTSTGSSVAYLFDTSDVLTNGDSLAVFKNAGQFRDAFDSSGALLLGSVTNVLSASGTNLKYTNGNTSVFLDVKSSSGTSEFGTTSGGHAIIMAQSGKSVYLGANANASGQVLVANTQFSPTTSGISLGTTANPWALTVSSHFAGVAGSSPTIATNSGAGLSGASASLAGTDVAGEITINSGLTPAVNAAIVTITFNAAYASAPYVLLWPSSATASVLGFLPYVTATTGGFVVSNAVALGLAESTTYKYNYHCIQ